MVQVYLIAAVVAMNYQVVHCSLDVAGKVDMVMATAFLHSVSIKRWLHPTVIAMVRWTTVSLPRPLLSTTHRPSRASIGPLARLSTSTLLRLLCASAVCTSCRRLSDIIPGVRIASHDERRPG